jgi:hypothetical protein
MINVGDETDGRIVNSPMQEIHSHWLAYVQGDDAVAASEKAKCHGAVIARWYRTPWRCLVNQADRFLYAITLPQQAEICECKNVY